MSKIEEIIFDNLRKEFEKNKTEIANFAIKRKEEFILYYESMLDTVKELKLNDATIFDFFERTNGNVRVINHKSMHPDYLQIRTDYNGDLLNYNRISLKPDTKYKIILIAIEE